MTTHPSPPPWKAGDILRHIPSGRLAHYKGEWRAGYFVDSRGNGIGDGEWITVLPLDDDGGCREEVWEMEDIQYVGPYEGLKLV